MKALIPLEAGRESISRLATQSLISKVKDVDVRCDNTGALRLVVKDTEYTLSSPHAKSQLRYELGIDARTTNEYADDPDLMTRMIKHSMNKRGNTELAFVRTPAAEIAEIHKADHPWIGAEELFNRVIDTVQPSNIEGIEDPMFSPRKGLSFRLVTKTNKSVFKQPREGHNRINEPSHAGLWVNSNGQVQVASYVYTLVCTNGACREHQAFIGTTNESYRDLLVTNVQQAYARSITMLDELIALNEHVAENPAAFAVHTAKTFGYSDRAVRRIVEALPSLPEKPTQYDVVSLITNLAQVHGDPNLEWFGGHAIGAFKEHACAHCAQPLKN